MSNLGTEAKAINLYIDKLYFMYNLYTVGFALLFSIVLGLIFYRQVLGFYEVVIELHTIL